MLNKIKEFAQGNDKLYVFCKSLKRRNDPVFAKIIRGYYDKNYPEWCTVLLEHSGDMMPDKIVYDISCGEEKHSRVGLYANIHHLLYRLKFAEMINAVPRVRWGEGMPYYDHAMDDITKNAFEYYFDPISEAANYPLCDFGNIIRSTTKHILIYQNMFDNSYKLNDSDIMTLAESYKKYIHLNNKTSSYINGEIEKIFGKHMQMSLHAKILGVHIRGTDFNLGLKYHPNVVPPKDYLKKVKEIFSGGTYDKIFIATEDSSIIDMFASEFDNNILYYKDVFRTSGKASPHVTPNDRELNNYRLGLEVLRDVYTLANCDGFVSGLSHVAFAVRYTNLALDKSFDGVYVIDNGINYKKH